MAFIYALTDSNNNIRYIGCTTCSLDKRLKEHLRSKEKTYKQNWITHNKRNNLPINIILIEEVNLEDIFKKEIYWISYYKDKVKLTNTTGGGEGVLNYKFSDQQKKKISENTKKAMQNPEIKLKMSLAKKNKPAKNRIKIKDNLNNIFDSITQAASHYNVSIAGIFLAIKEKRPLRNKISFEII